MSLLYKGVLEGASTSEAHFRAKARVGLLEREERGVVSRVTGYDWSDHSGRPDSPRGAWGAWYTSCSGGTHVLLGQAECEVRCYARGGLAATLRDGVLVRGIAWSALSPLKEQMLLNLCWTSESPEEWYDLEAEFDTVINRDRKKRLKER